MNNNQCASMTFFKFSGLFNQTLGAAKLLNLNFSIRRKNEGVEFFKLLGAGSGLGYRAWPKSGVIALFMVWENLEAAKTFFQSDQFGKLSKPCKEQYTLFLQPTSSRGTWSGFGDWRVTKNQSSSGLVCALARATIRRKYLFEFWKIVPQISQSQKDYRGLIFSQGVGEVPVLEQATFTVWENTQSMEEFAYTAFHGKAIQKVREANGFKEQMFTRFEPILTFGTWGGQNLLENYNLPVLENLSEVPASMANAI